MSKKQLATFRRNLGLLCHRRQEEVAKKAGISRVFINAVINGRASCTLDVALSIAQAVEHDIGDLCNQTIEVSAAS